MADKKFKFNILDVVIVIVVVACIAGIALRYNLADKIGLTKNQEAVVTFLAPNVRTDVARESFVDGDMYYCKKFNGNFGELIRLDEFIYEPAVRMKEDENGVMLFGRRRQFGFTRKGIRNSKQQPIGNGFGNGC